jgi:hypothetical protein
MNPDRINVRICPQCSSEFDAGRTRRIYCRAACRQARYYHRQRAELAELRERAGHNAVGMMHRAHARRWS